MATYVAGFEHDLFVSYAHLDNNRVLGDNGWVSELVDAVETTVAQRLGRREYFSLWVDRTRFQGNESAHEIPQEAQRSALFVAVLSPSYLASDDCKNELAAWVAARGKGAKGNIFIVKKLKTDDDVELPEALRSAWGYGFWDYNDKKEDRTFHTKDPKFYQQTLTLGQNIADRLKLLHKTGGSQGQQTPPPKPAGTKQDERIGVKPSDRPLVLLAEATDDLDLQREQVRSFLNQYDIDVCPVAPYPRPGLKNVLAADLCRCKAFVQLLGPLPGTKRYEEAPDGYPWLQYHEARQLNEALPILQWRSPDLDPTRVADDKHRKLLELPSVQKTTLEVFKQAVVDRVREPPSSPPPPPAPQSVFINADKTDIDNARKIQEALSDAWTVAIPSLVGNSKALRGQLEQYMLEYKSIIFLYGAAQQIWVDAQINQFAKIQPQRAKPPRSKIVLEAPPDDGKPSPSVLFPGLKFVNARNCSVPEIVSKLRSELVQ